MMKYIVTCITIIGAYEFYKSNPNNQVVKSIDVKAKYISKTLKEKVNECPFLKKHIPK